MALSDRDLQTLGILCAERGDDSSLAMSQREVWLDRAQRIMEDKATHADFIAAALLTEEDASLQRDAQVRERYMALAKRARTAGY